MRSLLALALAAPAVAFTPAVAPRKIVRGGRPLGPGFLNAGWAARLFTQALVVNLVFAL